MDVDGGGWKLVRHTPTGQNWHPASDQLAGINEYGKHVKQTFDSADAWSIEFQRTDFNEFLFATGDCFHWVVMDREQLNTANIGKIAREVRASSANPEVHEVVSWLRGRAPQDPWIAVTDLPGAIEEGTIVYGANSYGAPLATVWTKSLSEHNGANVYVRVNSDNPTSIAPRLELCENRGGFRECKEGPSILIGTRIGRVDGSGRTCKWNRSTAECVGRKCRDFTVELGNRWHRCNKEARKHKIKNNVIVDDFDWGCFFNVESKECLPELPTDVPCSAYNEKRLARQKKKQCKKIGTLVRGCKWDKKTELCVEGA